MDKKKQMKNKLFLLGMAGVLLTFGLLFIACDSGGGTTLVFRSDGSGTIDSVAYSFSVSGDIITSTIYGTTAGTARYAVTNSGNTLNLTSNSGPTQPPIGTYTKQGS